MELGRGRGVGVTMWAVRTRVGWLATLMLAFAVGVPSVPMSAEAGAPRAFQSAVPLSPCANSDHGLPVLTGLTVDPPVLDVRSAPGVLHLAATVEDTGGPGPAGGVASIRVWIVGLPHTAATPAETTLLPDADGVFRGDLTIRRGVRPGTYSEFGAEITEAAEDRYYRDRYNELVIYDAYGPADLARLGLRPQVTLMSDRDRTRPHITGLKVSRAQIDARRHQVRVRVAVRARDAGSGVAAVDLSVGDIIDSQLLEPSGAGWWRGSFVVRRYGPIGMQRIWVSATNGVGRDRLLAPPQLARRGWRSAVRVRARIDRTKPVFRIVRAPESVIDVRDGDKKAVTLVRAIDAESGVDFVGLGSSDGDDPLVPGRLVSGTRHNGLWRVELPLPQCGTPAWEWADVLSAHDRSWNWNEVVKEVHYRVINTDVIPPEIESLRSGETVRVVFDERVTGLTNTSAPVRAVLSTPRQRQVLGAPLEGTWTCRARSGTTVDCATGAFRIAAWRPAAPLDPAQSYIVDVNPEHVLDVTDLAGNPFDGRTAYNDTTF